MPMIDVYAAAGTFGDTHALAQELAAALTAVERVPDIPMFRKNTAAFVHELPSSHLSNVECSMRREFASWCQSPASPTETVEEVFLGSFSARPETTPATWSCSGLDNSTGRRCTLPT